MSKWEERRGVIDRLQAIANNPNPHMQSTGGDTADVLDRLGTISKGLLLLLDPPSPLHRGVPSDSDLWLDGERPEISNKCPHTESGMTPCYLRDGKVTVVQILGRDCCVGCEKTTESLQR